MAVGVGLIPEQIHSTYMMHFSKIYILFILSSLTLTSMAADYEHIFPELELVVEEEMREWNITGIAIALVDDQNIIFCKGFGEAGRDSIFRAGSISKLFNALAVMQLVEEGKMDLDAPIAVDQLPINPFPGEPAITLRHLLSHRSGLQRESPVGSYMDDSEPGIEATVRSIRQSVLVTRPGAEMRYSNIGPTLAGHIVEQTTGISFEEYQQKRLLQPLGMTESSWTLASTPAERIIDSYMRVADGEGGWTRRKAPVFDLGTIPAGNLFTTAGDLARFASALMGDGTIPVSKDSLRLMWTPQFTDSETGFGLGFVRGSFHGRPTIGHSGAVYGHSTSFVVLPDEKIAVIVLANEDIANGRVHRIHETALTLMLNAGQNARIPPRKSPVALDDLTAFAGEYESQSYWARLWIEGDRLQGDISGQPTRFTPTGSSTFTADSRILDAAAAEFSLDADGRANGFKLAGQSYVRVPEQTTPLPDEWHPVLGSYGLEFIPVIISERHGHLYAMTENMVDYRLSPVNRHVCALPPGMYVGEEVVFLPDSDGRIAAINFANMVFHRRN